MSTGVPTGTTQDCRGGSRVGCEHDHLMPALAQTLRELADVHLDAARILPGIGARERDAHQPASSGHAGSNTCQSAGEAEIKRSNACAITRVIAVASARRSPVGSGIASGQATPRQPSGV